MLGTPLLASWDGSPAAPTVYRLPDLWLPSGRVTACDGILLDGEPFDRRFNPGRYPGLLVTHTARDDERIAFAIVRFSAAPVVEWEIAAPAGGHVAALEAGHVFGYGVDSGTGCFCDPGALAEIDEASGREPAFLERVIEEMRKVYKHTRDWVHLETSRGSAALFSSGEGDGPYTSYWGHDRSGQVAALLTDFAVMDWPGRP